jgi:hypothetical protein
MAHHASRPGPPLIPLRPSDIEQRVILRGSLSVRPSASSQDGRRLFLDGHRWKGVGVEELLLLCSYPRSWYGWVLFAVPSVAETDATFVSRYHVMTDENRVSWVTHAACLNAVATLELFPHQPFAVLRPPSLRGGPLGGRRVVHEKFPRPPPV